MTPCAPTAALRPLAFAVWDGDSSWQGWRCPCGSGGVETGCTVSWRLTETGWVAEEAQGQTKAFTLLGRGPLTMWCPVGALCRWTVIFCPLGQQIRAIRPRKGRNTLSSLKHIPVNTGERNDVNLPTPSCAWTHHERCSLEWQSDEIIWRLTSCFALFWGKRLVSSALVLQKKWSLAN